MGYCTSRGTVGGIVQRLHYDTSYREGSRKGIFAFGASTSDVDYFDAFVTNITGGMTSINKMGVASATHTDLWGNATSDSRLSQLKTNVQTTRTYMTSGKVHGFGMSMGALTLLNWEKANPGSLKSLYAIIPVLNQQEIYDGNLGGFQSVISTAHAGRPPDSRNPTTNPSSFTGFPMTFYCSSDDPICLYASATSFASAVNTAGGNCTIVNQGAIGHNPLGSGFDGSKIASFFASND